MRDFSFLFQKRCIICHEKKRHKYLLCEDCLDKLVFVDGYRDIDGTDCYFPLLYQGLTKKLIYDYKLGRKEVVRYFLADVVSDKIKQKNLQDYTLLKVPSTQSKINKRGFDHIHEIAKEVEKILGMEYLPDSIVKVKETKIQHNLSQLQRIENLKGAFELNADLSDKKILVLDDIVTTKNTLREMKNTLNGNYTDLKFVAVSSKSNEKY
ncbi:MAG: ComF family protein [Finegoldia magna]|uniref:ComF family protein n=1 Tax=Finegoldia magna TaxID=1260 RepID=UPI00290CA4FC|nr:ComF family protein [Finegoldia magna]MDU5271969.1 ComF family protein [Finegoldia magna]